MTLKRHTYHACVQVLERVLNLPGSGSWNLQAARIVWLNLIIGRSLQEIRFACIIPKYSSYNFLNGLVVWLETRKNPLTLIYMGGGGANLSPPRQFFCYSSKPVGARLLKLCGFYCQPIAHNLVYFLVTWDLSCCHGNLILNRRLAKKRPKSESNFSCLWKIIKTIKF